MKRKGTLKKPKKRTIIILVVVLVIVAASAGVLVFLGLRGGQSQRPGQGQSQSGFPFGNMQGGMQGNMQGGMGGMMASEDMVMASGVTSVGVTEETFEVENMTTALEVEEVYVTSEMVVSEGDRVLKLSESSVQEARKELEQTLKEAQLAYRAGSIEYEQSKITAEYDRDSKLLSGQQAQAVYEETVSGLQTSVDRASEELTAAREEIAEYQSYVNNDSYRDYFKIDEYQAIYDENLEVLMARMEEWGVSWPQVTGQGSGMSSGSAGMGPSAGGASGAGQMSGIAAQAEGPSADQIQVLASLYDVLEENRKDLDQAQSDYEDALANASFELQTLELQLPDLEKSLSEAQKAYETNILQAKLTYETSLANAASAQSDYETAIQKAESDYENLKEDWEDAQENLALFEESVGDGYFYASGSGTVLRTMVRAGQSLTSEGVIFMYSNPAEMTVTVSVDQADISKIALGDSVYIQSSEQGSFEGIVTAIDPVSNSGSRTSVTYNVTVQFMGDSTSLGANGSVTVIFGMGTGTMPEMDRNGSGRGNGGSR